MEFTAKNAGNAMNTIPLTFDEQQINRIIVGGKRNDSQANLNISVILLNSRGSQFNIELLENLLDCKFQSIVSVEPVGGNKNSSIDDVSKKYPGIKFIIPLETATDGEMINMAMSEVDSDYVLVLRDNLYIPTGLILPHLAERLTNEGIFCIVPRLLDSNKNGIINNFSPSAEKSHFVVNSSALVVDGTKSLYPLDYIAIYNRKKFIQLGGFDYGIKNSYWQLLDLGLRSWLWGEETKLTTMLQFTYLSQTPVEDKTINLDYLRVHLKNELPKFKNERAYVHAFSFWKFFFNSSCGYLEARRQFKAAKKWIQVNRSRFKKDLPMFVMEWSEKNENK